MLYEINVFKECLNGKRLKYWSAEVLASDLIQAIKKSGLEVTGGRTIEIKSRELPKIIKPSRDGVA